MLRLALLLVAAFPLIAQPYSMAPASGPTAGGTAVTITGDFAPGPYTAFFNHEPAASTTLADAHTLVLITPPHLPGPTNVTIFKDGQLIVYMNVSFVFTGDVPAGFERVLLPIFSRPVFGAFGSEFRTALRIANSGAGAVPVYGLIVECGLALCIGPESTVIEKDEEVQPVYTGDPGRILWIHESAHLTMNLRVHDVTRSQLNFGTEIPIVRETDWVKNRIVLLGVPTDRRFRNTLRIYGQEPFQAMVTIGNGAPVHLALSSANGLFEVPYAAFGDFPRDGVPVRVTIESVPNDVPMWAMITVTNNETQLISTITPQD